MNTHITLNITSGMEKLNKFGHLETGSEDRRQESRISDLGFFKALIIFEKYSLLDNFFCIIHSSYHRRPHHYRQRPAKGSHFHCKED